MDSIEYRRAEPDIANGIHSFFVVVGLKLCLYMFSTSGPDVSENGSYEVPILIHTREPTVEDQVSYLPVYSYGEGPKRLQKVGLGHAREGEGVRDTADR